MDTLCLVQFIENSYVRNRNTYGTRAPVVFPRSTCHFSLPGVFTPHTSVTGLYHRPFCAAQLGLLVQPDISQSYIEVGYEPSQLPQP